MKTFLMNLVALILCGGSIGWMVGMSASPIIQGILTTVFSFVIILLGVVAGIESNSVLKIKTLSKDISLLPIGVFFLFLSLGSAGGIYTRTNDYLGIQPERYYKKWEAYGMKKDSVFNILASKDTVVNTSGGGLLNSDE
jgi:hypothetical protein